MLYREQGCNSWVVLPRPLEFPAEACEHAGTVMLGLHIHIASRSGFSFVLRTQDNYFLQVVFSKGKVSKFEESL